MNDDLVHFVGRSSEYRRSARLHARGLLRVDVLAAHLLQEWARRFAGRGARRGLDLTIYCGRRSHATRAMLQGASQHDRGHPRLKGDGG